MLIAFFAIIYKPLNLQRPFQESEVRDSECLVYTASQPFGAGFSYLPPYACQSIPPAVSIFTTLTLDTRLIIISAPSQKPLKP